MSDFPDLAVFVRVAERGGFSPAARELGISKSAASKKVAALEDRLGARLLNRTTRKLSLTEEGAAFLDRARRILADLEEAEQAVGRMHETPRGTLRVNAPMSFGIAHVAPALPEFLARCPELSVTVDLNDRVVDLIDEGYDLAIRIAALPDSSLVARRLAPARRVVCATPGYWDRHGRPEAPADLARHEALIYTYLTRQNEWPFTGPGGPVVVPVSGRLRANNGDALRAAALGGLGVYLAPTFIVGEDVRAGRLESVLGEFIEDELSVYAVYPHRRHLSAKVRAFVDFLAERYGPRPYWDC